MRGPTCSKFQTAPYIPESLCYLARGITCSFSSGVIENLENHLCMCLWLKEKNLFEFLQKNLEEKTDALHEMLEKDFDLPLDNLALKCFLRRSVEVSVCTLGFGSCS